MRYCGIDELACGSMSCVACRRYIYGALSRRPCTQRLCDNISITGKHHDAARTKDDRGDVEVAEYRVYDAWDSVKTGFADHA